jgi:acetyltransferase
VREDRMGAHYLDKLFSPGSIAVFGASERSHAVGARVFENLHAAGFPGTIHAINPKYRRVNGQPCHPAIGDVQAPVDLAVIATPLATIPDILNSCGDKGVQAAIVISAASGDAGDKSARAVLDAARRHRIRLLGPNCLGLLRPAAGLNASFSRNTAKDGRVAFVSQSGALCTAVMDWAAARDIGFSAVVSLGNAVDIDFGDIFDYLAQDGKTDSILVYVEGVRHARSFMSGLRIAARMKPLIVLKAGRHDTGSRAAATHTGALTGADDVFDAALQRAGAVRAGTIEQLFAAARLLASRRRVDGNRLAIVTNGGGLGVMATDRAADLNVALATLGNNTLARLDKCLPPQWSHANPVDLVGDAPPQRYRDAVALCLDDANVDGVLAMLSPQAMTDAEACAQAVVDARGTHRKPVLACWMGEAQVEAGKRLFARHHVPEFPSPEASVEAFAYLAGYHRNQQLLMQVPGPLGRHSEPDVEGARLIIANALADKRALLSATESKAVLRAFSIPVTQGIECRSAGEALVAAESIGFPVAMKINSPDISHKSDVGGVHLNLGNAGAIRGAYDGLLAAARDKRPDAHIVGVIVEPMYTPAHGRELLIGATRDPVFGSVIVFGAGGVHVEALRDRAVSLPPLNRFLAEQMIGQTQVARLLQAHRDMPAANMDELVQTLRRVSEMVCELPEITELDINPLIAAESAVIALDARIGVAARPPSLERYSHLAIHPYPSHLVSRWKLPNGETITIRPIRPEDASIEQSFVRDLSPQSKYFRFMQGLNELTQEMLVRFTQLDYNRELALIAVLERDGRETELAVARYVTNPDGQSCEFAVVVADQWQHIGIGSHLICELIDAARRSGLRTMTGEILASNHEMLKLAEKLGFSVYASADDPGIRVVSRAL